MIDDGGTCFHGRASIEVALDRSAILRLAGGGDDVLRLVEVLEQLEIPWCMIGGLAVNHWAAEPLATADVDIVIAHQRVDDAVAALVAAGFQAERFDWSVNLKGSSRPIPS